jgi:hypothetical protein
MGGSVVAAVGPFVLPALAALIVIVWALVAVYWIFDGSDASDNPEADEHQRRRRSPQRTQNRAAGPRT